MSIPVDSRANPAPKPKTVRNVAPEVEQLAAADALAAAVSAYNMQKLLWKPAMWRPVAEALAAYRKFRDMKNVKSCTCEPRQTIGGCDVCREPSPCGCWVCSEKRPSISGIPGMNETNDRMIVCPDCGNKRCPKATFHAELCSGSNEPGQDGSRYER